LTEFAVLLPFDFVDNPSFTKKPSTKLPPFSKNTLFPSEETISKEGREKHGVNFAGMR
jgi:hypothetical protein